MIDFLLHLFATDFNRRFDCINNPVVAWMLIVGDLAIFLCYMGTAAVMFRSRAAWRGRYMLGLALFIFACGGGHLWLTLMSWWPAYRAYAVWNVFTGVASVNFLLMLPGMVRDASPEGRLRFMGEQLDALRAENARLRAGAAQ